MPRPVNVTAEDKPNDEGGTIVVRWDKVEPAVQGYEVIRIDEQGERHTAGTVPPIDSSYEDKGDAKAPVKDGARYRYVVRAVYGDGKTAESEPTAEVAARPSWFHSGRTANLVAVLMFAFIFVVLVRRARKGAPVFIRPIAGLVMLEDAVGRAAEMGRPVLYSPGLLDATDPATMASMTILSKVGERAARLRTRVKVPNYSPMTWPVAQKVVRDAYLKAGRPEEYDPDDIPYFTSRSFAFAAAVIGMMVREKTASNFLMGHFFSESLILAETGVSIGALQIGGTDSHNQLPFFITTCDYTLIGEELFAAAAQIDEDPVNRSTIASHDWFKVLAAALMIAGLVLGVLDVLGIDGAAELAGNIAAAIKESP